ncbi:MAG: DUF4302 domain-containing protein [Prevotella sp.]|nr:DUF4302 domain-containing protein [Prevotella sp.]
MKTNKIILCLLLALPAALLTSCLKDQDDVFDKSSSIRMDEFLTAVRDTLKAAPNGWAFDYYPSPTQQYGGRTYLLSFDDDNVTARYEKYPDDEAETTSYILKSDMGPVLSFDSYSNFLHADATASSGKYEGNEGDFEFVIDSLGADRIKVHGKRNGNTMYLHRLPVSQDEYMQKLLLVYGQFSPAEFVLTANGQSFTFNAENHGSRELIVTDASGNEVADTHYTYTDKGIRLYEPISLNGVQVWDLTYDDASLRLSAPGVESASFTVDPVVAAGLIGEVSTGNNAYQHTYPISHADQFTVTADQDWIHVSTDGGTLTVTLDANTSGAPRFGNITLSCGSYSATVGVSQMTVDDLIGKYRLTTTDESGKVTMYNATIASAGQSGVLTLTVNNFINSDAGNLKMKLLYLADSHSLLLQSAVQCGTLNNTYLVAPGYIWGDGRYSSMGVDAVFTLLKFATDAGGALKFSLLGDIYIKDNGLVPFGAEAETMIIGAFEGNTISRDSYAGYIEKWEKADMVKTGTLASPAAPNHMSSAGDVPLALKRQAGYLDLSAYNMSRLKAPLKNNIQIVK